MKQLTWKLVLPLTVISFMLFTKWWYVEIDGPDEILKGFPLPFVCRGWHTSLSLQIFVFELIVDLFTYFSFWFLVILAATRIFKSFCVPKFVTIILLVTSGLFTLALGLLAVNPDNIYTATRDFDIKILETGYRFVWQDEFQPDYYKYHPEMKKKSIK